MPQNAAAIGLKYLVVDFLGGIVYFPIWWYTRGLVRMGKFVLRNISSYNAILGVKIWIKNIFVPMYGARDIQGRLISFFMRTVQIIGRSFFLLVFVIMYTVLFFLYLVLPLFVIYQIVFHLIGGFI